MKTKDTMKDVLATLTSKDDTSACALCERMISESRETDQWVDCLEEFAALLDHPKSLVRNRALYLLAANARWDDENKFDGILTAFLSHITDEKPVTARQCIKALSEVGQAKPHHIPEILLALKSADLSQYKDSMRPLLEKDIEETVRILGEFRLQSEGDKNEDND